MLDRNDTRTITANVDEVLTALRLNLIEHNEILAEARMGYTRECKKALGVALATVQGRLTGLAEGADVKMDHILFNLTPPQNHAKDFATIIRMLELHKAAHEGNPDNHAVQYDSGGVNLTKPATPATIELKAADVQKYVLNDWSWMDSFLVSNAGYSGKSMAIAATKGLL